MNIRRWIPRRGLLLTAMLALAAVVVPAAPASASAVNVFCSMSLTSPSLSGGVVSASAFVTCSDTTSGINLSVTLLRDGAVVSSSLSGGTFGASGLVAETCRPGLYQATASATVWYPFGHIPSTESFGRSSAAIYYNCAPPPATVVVTNPGSQQTFYPDSASLQMTASGGTGPYTWSATGLPTGLSINSSTGLISGRPTIVALYSVTVTATAAGANPGSTTFSWRVRREGCRTC
jgi:hypothetical protein